MPAPGSATFAAVAVDAHRRYGLHATATIAAAAASSRACRPPAALRTFFASFQFPAGSPVVLASAHGGSKQQGRLDSGRTSPARTAARKSRTSWPPSLNPWPRSINSASRKPYPLQSLPQLCRAPSITDYSNRTAPAPQGLPQQLANVRHPAALLEQFTPAPPSPDTGRPTPSRQPALPQGPAISGNTATASSSPVRK